jgi:hypothetical protein
MTGLLSCAVFYCVKLAPDASAQCGKGNVAGAYRIDIGSITVTGIIRYKYNNNTNKEKWVRG